MTINVEHKHITDGIKKSCFQCPIALAIGERLRPNIIVRVSNTRVTLHEDGNCLDNIRLPEDVVEFIKRFDKDYPGMLSPQPFSFDIDIRMDLLNGR